MKTKFIKVSTADRLPEKTGVYIIEKSSVLMASWFNGLNFFRNAEIILVEYWLEERPDYEEEMKEMLQKSLDFIEELAMLIPANWLEKFRDHYNRKTNEIEELLTKLK